MSEQQTGAVTGAGIGAVLGGITGAAVAKHDRALGAAIGAAAGAAVGGLVGWQIGEYRANKIKEGPQAAVEKKYVPEQGVVAKIDSTGATPAQLKPGDQIILKTVYTVLTPPQQGAVAVKEVRTIRFNNESMGQFERTTNLSAGSYATEQPLTLPADAAPGTYMVETIVVPVVEKSTKDQATTTFAVDASARTLAEDISARGKAAVYTIYFDFNKAEVQSQSAPTLEEIATLLRQHGELKLYIVGHTDNVGEFNYNMRLSKARADAVVQTLVSRFGVEAKRLQSYGVGPLVPVTSNKTEEGRAKNRRVELVEQ
jgi:outer membrane protein OmpA-like peptidoglycan-associated protein